MHACTHSHTHTHTNTHSPLLTIGQILLVLSILSYFTSTVLTVTHIQVSSPNLYFQLLVLTFFFCIQNDTHHLLSLGQCEPFSNIPPLLRSPPPMVVKARLPISCGPLAMWSMASSLSLLCLPRWGCHV